MHLEQFADFEFLAVGHGSDGLQRGAGRHLDVLEVAEVDDPLLLEGIGHEGGQVPGLEDSQDVMGRFLGLFGLPIDGGVFIDLLAESAQHLSALRDVAVEGRLDMIHFPF